MRGRAHYVLPLIIALATPGSIMMAASPAGADACLAAPKLPAPKGGRWYYRFDAKQNKCWHLVWEGAPAKAAAQPQPAAKQAAAPAPTVADDEGAKPDPQDARPLVTKDVSEVAPDDALVIVPPEPSPATDATEQPGATISASADAAPAPIAGPAALATPAEPIPAPAKVAAAAEPETSSLSQYVFLVLIAIALAGGAILYLNEMRRRRSDVLRMMERSAPAPRRLRPREPRQPVADKNVVRLSDALEQDISRLVHSRLRRAA